MTDLEDERTEVVELAQELCWDFFCWDCGACAEHSNRSCWLEHHCHECGACIDEPGCPACYEVSDDYFLCESCSETHYVDHCDFCNQHLDVDVEECDCGFDQAPHCTSCSDMKCENCGICLSIDGNMTEHLYMGGCEEHEICYSCIVDDEYHCKDCHSCDSEICEECYLGEECYADRNHCPLCDLCFGYGNEYDRCLSGGDHCTTCCEENEWLCPECGDCVEATGKELCPDCDLCEECCLRASEDEGCTHGYCIFSSDYDSHTCPNCQQCPDDEECEYCGFCEECQSMTHCEHGVCPDDSDWDDHVCQDCGECSDEEPCEYCGRCENCALGYHCEHDYCPDGDDYEDGLDHYVCEQCGECHDGDRCDDCELCRDCCEANTEDAGCTHSLCIESSDFADHWCYEDDQCLEDCNHDADCAHTNKGTDWHSDGQAHWHACADCGAAVDKAIHTEGEAVTVTEPDAAKRKNGKASISCTVCATLMSTVSVPYATIPDDGTPYILIQPTDYTGKTSTVSWTDDDHDVDRYATFKVTAGGKNLKYQWYQHLGTGTPKTISDDNYYYEGTQTATLKVRVFTDACDGGYQKYYCVVSNSQGTVTTRTAVVNAQHVYGHYDMIDYETHAYYCNGECGTIKATKKHRFGEWTVVRPATDTEMGLREQLCLDCNYKLQSVIAKVEPGHVHEFTVAYHNATEHWFACKCGVVSDAPRQAHTFGEPVITREPTEKTTGQQELTCTVCRYTKTESVDKLPHTHDWWTTSSIPSKEKWVKNEKTKQEEPNTKYWGRSGVQHYFHCKNCDQLNVEGHVWGEWSVKREPKDTIPGIAYRYCQTCRQQESLRFPAGTYPVLLIGGTSDKEYAAPGETVTITFNAKYFRDNESFGTSGPIKHEGWYDYADYIGSSSDRLPWGTGSIAIPRLTFANPKSAVTTFVMPYGPALAGAGYTDCDHTDGTHMGERVEPSCAGYGHEPDTLCNGCGQVMGAGARIQALGHDLPANPVAGTEKPLYCTFVVDSTAIDKTKYTVTHPTGKGYAGDFVCNRCAKTVAGPKTAIVHRQHITRTALTGKTTTAVSNPYTVRTNRYVQATCTQASPRKDTICYYCEKVLGIGKKDSPTGHNWGDWVTVKDSTATTKGLQIHYCLNDSAHTETRLTDYMGPDYRLKANKTRVNFTWTYGETPEPQSVTFTSIGRSAISKVNVGKSLPTNPLTLKADSMTLTIKPRPDVALNDPSQREVTLFSVIDPVFGTIKKGYFTAPEIIVSFTIKKVRPALSFAESSRSAVLGDSLSPVALLTGVEDYMTELKWQSSDNNVAMVDAATGQLKLRAEGTTVITVKYAGDDYHASSQASFTLTVCKPKRGDVNMDGSITIADVTALVNIILGKDNTRPYRYNHSAADVNLDGSTTIADVTRLVNIILGKEQPAMYVEDMFTLTGRGTVATGQVLSGVFKTGQKVVLRSTRDAIGDVTTTITGIEMFRTSVSEAKAGDNVGILLQGVSKDQVKCGDLLTVPGNTAIHHSKTIKGKLYVYTKDEGGRNTPFNSSYAPTMTVGGKDFSTKIADIGTVDGTVPTLVMPGSTVENIVFEIQPDDASTDAPVAVTPYSYIGQEVLIRESGRTIGKLTITGYGE